MKRIRSSQSCVGQATPSPPLNGRNLLAWKNSRVFLKSLMEESSLVLKNDRPSLNF